MPSSAVPLPFDKLGDDPRPPIVLIHGFAGDRLAWADMQPRLAAERTVYAFDLPGHGDAIDWPEVGNAAVAAKALGASLAALGIARCHLVGHSMGGAVAALIGLRSPERVASATLIAPGGFGPEINARLLQRFAAVREPHEIALVSENFFGFRSPIPDGLWDLMAAVRARPGVIGSFRRIVETLVGAGGRQGVLPLDDLARAGFPIHVIWGDQDHVLPQKHLDACPPSFARHLFPAVGHMAHVEARDAVIRIVLMAAAHA